MPRDAVEEHHMQQTLAKAHVEFDPAQYGVRVALTRSYGDDRYIFLWEAPAATELPAGGATAPDNAWLRLGEDEARALYEALGDYFGHSGHDTRALRKDYDAERQRVDRLIGHLIGKPHG